MKDVTYEVTVPITVTVIRTPLGYFIDKVEFDRWGGFFSEAEDSAGVWLKEQIVDDELWEGEWGDDDQDTIYKEARDYIRERIEREDG